MNVCIILLTMLATLTGSLPTSKEGTATWFPVDGYVAAAGPGIRHWHADWRGATVKVCSGECITVELTDWCACPDTLIDLGWHAFDDLASLRKGRIKVTVTWLTSLPPTDTAP